MPPTPHQLWLRYQQHLCSAADTGITLDVSRMNFSDTFLDSMESRMQQAFREMQDLEKGAIANPDEKRMVGHYWLRTPELAPTSELKDAIKKTLGRIQQFTKDVHSQKIRPPTVEKFDRLLVIGIGGSALGPQFVAHALGHPDRDRMDVHFFDNTDPDGMDLALAQLGGPKGLASTLVVVISKSGGTKETRNGMLEVQEAFRQASLNFSKQAIAITGDGSDLSKVATSEGWLDAFPMWDWVGGRTSETSAVGLLPAALQGIDINDFLDGAAKMDAATRSTGTRSNPAAMMALMWHHATDGCGSRDMVVLPYKDRLLLFSRYLQQLVMESLGKEKNLKGQVVHQGISVYGNKGSTDQHAYVQQLRDGVKNFFITFIQVLKDRDGESLEVEKDVTSGDYLHGFLLGTRQALYESGRESITLALPDLSSRSIGALIALYERAVGFYASLVGINAYHQPGVEAGKKAAGTVVDLQKSILTTLRSARGKSFTADQLAKTLGQEDQAETIYQILQHLASNSKWGLKIQGTLPEQAKFGMN